MRHVGEIYLGSFWFIRVIPHKKLTNIKRCLTDPANQCLTDVEPILTDTISHTLHIQS